MTREKRLDAGEGGNADGPWQESLVCSREEASVAGTDEPQSIGEEIRKTRRPGSQRMSL